MDRRVLHTLDQLLTDRGYNCNDLDGVISIVNHKTKDKKMVIVFIDDDKMGINHAKQIETQIAESGIAHALVIYNGTITTFAKGVLDNIEVHVELFCSDELLYNVSRHVLVPKHTLLDSSQKADVLKKYKVHERNMPFISKTDPVCKYYGGKPGDLFHIMRPSANTLSSTYYRLVT